MIKHTTSCAGRSANEPEGIEPKPVDVKLLTMTEAAGSISRGATIGGQGVAIETKRRVKKRFSLGGVNIRMPHEHQAAFPLGRSVLE